MTAPTPKEIRAARAYLYQQGLGFIRPMVFAAAAKEQNVKFKTLHKILEPWLGKPRKSTKDEGGSDAQVQEEQQEAVPAAAQPA